MAKEKRGFGGLREEHFSNRGKGRERESRLFSPIRLFGKTVHVSRVNFPQGDGGVGGGKCLRTRQRLKRKNLLSRRPRLRLEIERGRAYILVCQFLPPLQPG